MKMIGKIILGVLGLVVVLVLASALSNIGLPTQSSVVDHLSDGDKGRIAEYFNLWENLGDEVWPGSDQKAPPVIVYNEAYAFLVGYPGNPPDGWVKMPVGEHRGAAWEAVPDDTFQGEPYYRQFLPDPEKTPENFTVTVGDEWVATLQTYEFAAIDFYDGFKEQLPGFLRPIFPYRVFWNLLIPNSETHVAALVHESFHAFQAEIAPQRFTAGELAVQQESAYPWDEEGFSEAWETELDLLYRAVTAGDVREQQVLVDQFIAQREGRRATFGLPTDQINYEKEREWLEGLAKYVEISMLAAAEEDPAYHPAGAIVDDGDFDNYQNVEKYVSRQIEQVTHMANQGETRFYYTGLCMGLLLDQLAPGWQAQAFDQGVYLEDLLSHAIGD